MSKNLTKFRNNTYFSWVDYWWNIHSYILFNQHILFLSRGCRGSDRMAVGFTTTCECCGFEPRSDAVYSIHQHVIKFVSDLREVGETDRHDLTEILLKAALSTINQTNLFLSLIYSRFLFYHHDN